MAGVEREPNLILIGLRGSGKSTLARALARRQGRIAIDLDDLTPGYLGCATVGEAWNLHGQGAFREAEFQALSQALAANMGAVIALGGGAPTAPGAADLIEAAIREGRAVVVYLRDTPRTLADRLRALPKGPGPSRPSLTGADPIDEIAAVFAQRDPLYSRLATRTLNDSDSLESVLDALADWPKWV